MALTELQLPTKENFFRSLQNSASSLDNIMRNCKNLAEFIGFVEASDLDAMAVASGQVRTDLANFRTAMNELIAFYEGTGTTRTNVPSVIIDKVRTM